MDLFDLEREGFIRVPGVVSKKFAETLLLAHTLEDNGTWSKLDIGSTYQPLIDEVHKTVDESTLGYYTPDIATGAIKCSKGYTAGTHMDMSVYSPYLAQKFFIPSGESIILRHGDASTFSEIVICDGDLVFFYTYPSAHVFSIPPFKTEAYVVSALPCFPVKDIYATDSWIFSDVVVEWT